MPGSCFPTNILFLNLSHHNFKTFTCNTLSFKFRLSSHVIVSPIKVQCVFFGLCLTFSKISKLKCFLVFSAMQVWKKLNKPFIFQIFCFQYIRFGCVWVWVWEFIKIQFFAFFNLNSIQPCVSYHRNTLSSFEAQHRNKSVQTCFCESVPNRLLIYLYEHPFNLFFISFLAHNRSVCRLDCKSLALHWICCALIHLHTCHAFSFIFPKHNFFRFSFNVWPHVCMCVCAHCAAFYFGLFIFQFTSFFSFDLVSLFKMVFHFEQILI